MKKRTATVVLISALGVGAVSTAALTPAFAATGVTSAASHRLTDLKNALTGLVREGTITQAQADKVATTLDSTLPRGFGPEGHGPRGRGLPEAAQVLGLTPKQLRTALGTDKSLAQVAAARGISRPILIRKLVTAAKAHIASEVKHGRLTQTEADQRLANLTSRITELVDRVGMPMRGDHGMPPAEAPAAPPPAQG